MNLGLFVESSEGVEVRFDLWQIPTSESYVICGSDDVFGAYLDWMKTRDYIVPSDVEIARLRLTVIIEGAEVCGHTVSWRVC